MYSQIDSNKRKTVFLIGIFILIIIGLGWLVGEITGYGSSVLFISACIAILMSLFSYYKGDKMALWSSGAKQIKKEDNPYVYRMVENLCITAGLPMPKVHIIQDSAPNAFATGRDPEHASIAITTGLIEMLENEELEGVIAHELSHIKNYDIRIMTIVIVLVGIVALMADWLWRFRIFGGNSNKRSGQAGAILMIIGVILIILAPLFAKLIQLAVSRKREYLADASGALLTRYPEGLAKALEKISTYTKPMRHANAATAHLYITNPFGAHKKVSNLFSTHPPIKERVKQLRSMA